MKINRLEYLDIQGFQSHVNTRIDFPSMVPQSTETSGDTTVITGEQESQGSLNILIGDNASGKSAIRRALLWVLTNRPAGNQFINWGLENSEPCVVELGYAGHKIVRRKSRDGKVNEYHLDSTVFTAFGQSVPEPITELLQLDDTNIELQHDALFMLMESAPDSARRLNKLTAMDGIDTAYSQLRSLKNENSRAIKAAETKLTEVKSEIARYSGIEDIGQQVAALEVLDTTVKSLMQKDTDITALLHDIQEERGKLIKDTPPTSVQVINDLLQSVNTLISEYNTLTNMLYELQVSATSIIDLATGIPGITGATVGQWLQDVQQVSSVYTQLTSLLQQMQEQRQRVVTPPVLSSSIDLEALKKKTSEYSAIDRTIKDIVTAATTLSELQEQYEQLRAEYEASLPETCPLCGSPMDDHNHLNTNEG